MDLTTLLIETAGPERAEAVLAWLDRTARVRFDREQRSGRVTTERKSATLDLVAALSGLAPPPDYEWRDGACHDCGAAVTQYSCCQECSAIRDDIGRRSRARKEAAQTSAGSAG